MQIDRPKDHTYLPNARFHGGQRSTESMNEVAGRGGHRVEKKHRQLCFKVIGCILRFEFLSAKREGWLCSFYGMTRSAVRTYSKLVWCLRWR